MPKPTKPTSVPSPYAHLGLTGSEEIRKIRAEFAEKMKEMAKTWPGRRKAKRRQR